MFRQIVGFQRDTEEVGQWLVKLDCHHFQHVRHNPPWQVRLWTQSEEGRFSMIGHKLNCMKCESKAPKDW